MEIENKTLVESGAVPPDNFTNCIDRIREIARFDLEQDELLSENIKRETSSLALNADVIDSIVDAIEVGHVILQGPPGTGKSSLAQAIARAYNTEVIAVTAHEDWTVYDVVGRLELGRDEEGNEIIVPVNGCFTESVIRCANNVVKHFDEEEAPSACWLLIDELNRAYMDKAFGELFTVLGTDDLTPVTLPHQGEGNRKLVIPRRFRIIATLNSYDRQFVNNLSQAIRRRFTFISIDTPPPKPDSTPWDFDTNSNIPAIRELSISLRKACSRVARRMTSTSPDEFEKVLAEVEDIIKEKGKDAIFSFIELIHELRYAKSQDLLHLPIGTAQIIDTLELFVVRSCRIGFDRADFDKIIDWATSVKIAPSFESDAIEHEALSLFTNKLGAPFDGKTKPMLLSILNAGMSYTDES